MVGTASLGEKIRSWWHGKAAPKAGASRANSGKSRRATRPRAPKIVKPDIDDGLDNSLRKRIKVLEKLWGSGFGSPIGEDFLKAITSSLDIQAGQPLLDFGSSLGGPALTLRETYGCEVTALEPRRDHLTAIQHRAKKDPALELIDYREFRPDVMDLPARHYRTVLIRETMFTLKVKDAFLKKIKDTMTGGGNLVICDYVLRSPKMRTEAILKWTGQEPKKLSIVSADDLMSYIRLHGFKIASHKDLTEQYLTRIDRARDQVMDMLNEMAAADDVDKDFASMLLQEANLWVGRQNVLKSGDVGISYICARTKKSGSMSDWS